MHYSKQKRCMGNFAILIKKFNAVIFFYKSGGEKQFQKMSVFINFPDRKLNFDFRGFDYEVRK